MPVRGVRATQQITVIWGRMGAFPWQGSAAAITGAASGIGRSLALRLAAQGCDLALADMDEEGLGSVRAEIINHFSRQVLIRKLDVADRVQVESFARAAQELLPHLNILINNAGVALMGQFDEYDDE